MNGMGKRIKARREFLNLTQEELAFELGYKSKSTIAKIESGVNDIAQSKIMDYANALNTTPEYLMGLDENDVLKKRYEKQDGERMIFKGSGKELGCNYEGDRLLYDVIRSAIHQIFEELHGDVFGDYYGDDVEYEISEINRTGKWVKGFCNLYVDNLVDFYNKVIRESVRLEVRVDKEYSKVMENSILTNKD